MSQNIGPTHDIQSAFGFDAAVPNRLVHLIPDELARRVPDHSMFAYPKTTKVEDGFEEVTATKFANAINRTSWWLESTLGKDPEGFPAVGYMGASKTAPCSWSKPQYINSIKMTSDISCSCLEPLKLDTRSVKHHGLNAYYSCRCRCCSYLLETV